MSYVTELTAIEKYINSNWTDTPIIYDAQGDEPVANTISIHIQSGAVNQGSVGRAQNRKEYVGLLQIVIYTEAGKGSRAWRGYAEGLKDLFHEKRLADDGTLIAAVDQEHIRFSPNNMHPYIAGTDTHASLMTTTINAPFVRYETE